MAAIVRVEVRKLIRRKEVYILAFFMLFLSFFINQQLTSENPILTVTVEGRPSRIPLPEFFHGILGIFHSIGIFTAMLAVIIWNIIGKETDQKVISHYFVNTGGRLQVYFAKIVLSLTLITGLFILFIGSFLLFSRLFQPVIIEWTYTMADLRELSKILLLNFFLYYIYTLCAFLLALFLGSIGTLIGTVGLPLFFAFLKFFEGADSFNPVVINNIYSMDTMGRSLFINLLYVTVLTGLYCTIAGKKDVT